MSDVCPSVKTKVCFGADSNIRFDCPYTVCVYNNRMYAYDIT